MKKIREIERGIRDVINRPRVQHRVMQDRRDWTQLCASLDLIGDTQLAIDTYASTTFSDDDGVAYLLVFGFYQACFLQQDATTHLAEVLGIRLPVDAGLNTVRNTRNDIVGHPTKRGSQATRTSHVISRVTLSKWGFDVVSTSPTSGDLIFRHVDVRGEHELQRTGIEVRLQLIESELRNRERNHAMHFSKEKLADIFPDSLSYHCGKIFEGTDRTSGRPIAKANLELVSDWVEKFRSALTDRGELPGNDTIGYLLSELSNPFERLRAYFAGNSPLNSADAYAFAFFLHAKVAGLVELAREIDQSYEEEKSA